MQHQMVTTAARPSRAQIEPVALELLSRHSAGLLATARRYSQTPEDAEDAYQRGVEILLTKAPTTREADLLPWLKTVVKHEAYAVAKSSGRALASSEIDGEALAWTDDRAERYERLRVGAEAMAGLKPQEIRCLLLKAEGLSYQEICDATGFSYTKVNRCLTEGRRSFLKRVAGIESGAECERLAPLISKVADGEASSDEMRQVRPHLKSCLACKATLREYRATPSRVAGLVPPVVALAGSGGMKVGLLARFVDRFAGLGDAAGAKVAGVMAAGVVLAGGSAAGLGALEHHDRPRVAPSAYERTLTTSATAPQTHAAGQSPPASEAPDPRTAVGNAVANAHAEATKADSAKAPAAARPKTAPRADPQPEFDPGTTAGSGSSGTQATEFASSGAGTAPTGGGSPPGASGDGASGSGAAGEFLP